MPEVTEGKGCNFSLKKHIIFKKGTNKMGHLPTYNAI
jgi:hypothetical protein